MPAVPELGNVTQVWVLLAGGCLGIGVFGRAREAELLPTIWRRVTVCSERSLWAQSL